MKNKLTHIVVKNDLPDGIARIPNMMSGEVAVLLNISKTTTVDVDNSCVSPDFIKEHNLEDSVIVGSKSSAELGIDIDDGGDYVSVFRLSETTKKTNVSPMGEVQVKTQKIDNVSPCRKCQLHGG